MELLLTPWAKKVVAEYGFPLQSGHLPLTDLGQTKKKDGWKFKENFWIDFGAL